MRNLNTIDNDINKFNSTIKSLEQCKSKSTYDWYSRHKSRGVGFIIILCISAILLFAQFINFSNSDNFIFGGLSAIFFIIAFVCFIKYCTGSISFLTAKKYSIFGLLSFSFCLASILEFSKYMNENIILPDKFDNIVFTYAIINKGKFPVFFFNTAANDLIVSFWLIFTLFCTVPFLAFLIASVSKCVKQYLCVKKCDDKIKDFELQIDEKTKKLYSLKCEKQTAIKECEVLYEKAKSENDVEGMNRLNDLGYQNAATWLKNYKKEQDKKEGEKIYAAEIALENPDKSIMLKAAQLGCTDACVWIAENYFFEIQRMKGDGIITDDEWESKIVSIENVVRNAKDRSSSARIVYIFIRSTFYAADEYKNESDYQKTLDKLRYLQQSGKLSQNASDLCEMMIKIFVEQINNIREQKSSSYSYSSYSESDYSPSYSSGVSDVRSYVDSLDIPWYSSSGIDKIRNDPNLTDSQKEDALSYYRVYYD